LVSVRGRPEDDLFQNEGRVEHVQIFFAAGADNPKDGGTVVDHTATVASNHHHLESYLKSI